MTNATPADVLLRYLAADILEKEQKKIKEECRQQLDAYRELGLIDSKFSAHGLVANYSTRKTWQYSPDVKRLQHSEQLDGRAIQVESASWTIRPSRTQAET